jgi:DNA topoisomerase-1
MNQQRVKYKTLIIVESPSKCRTIEKLLGPGYMCVASCGHIREISDGLTGLHLDTILSDPEWMPSYTTITKKLHHVRTITAAISECNGIILLGTDADREGEAIAWHICEHFALPVKTTPRITFNEITQTALERAIRNPRVIDMQLVRAQQARQVLDLMIGYKITPLLWKSGSSIPNKNKKQILSAGRCQTPALRLVYDNDIENRALSLHPKYYYNCVAYFTSHNIRFSLSRDLEVDEIEPFLKFYTNVTGGNIQHAFEVDPDIVRMTQPAPSPLKTSTLQQLANSNYGMTSSETMESAQLLYERGLITYHRTDVTQLSEEFRGKALQYIERKWGKEYVTNVSQSPVPPLHAHAHEAIRPIDVTLTVDKIKIISRSSGGDDITKNECRIYHLVWMRAVQSCMRPAMCDKLTARIRALSGIESVYEYTHNAFRPVFAGWRACELSDGASAREQDISARDYADIHDNEDKDKEKGDNPFEFTFTTNTTNNKSYFDFLMAMKPGSLLPYNSISCITKLRNGPKHYTEGGLIKRMEELGIGRPSTFASIMHTLRKREFVVKRDIIRNIGTHFDCVNYAIKPGGEVSAVGPKILHGTNNDNTAYEFGTERNKLQLTDEGRMVIETLIPRCDSLFAYDYTTKMECVLDEIVTGGAGDGSINCNWRDICRTCLRDIDAVITEHSNLNEASSGIDVAKSHDGGNVSGVLRTINKYASVRDGKYGAYIFYKPPKYKKPKFVSLKGFPHNALKCEDTVLVEWIEEHP